MFDTRFRIPSSDCPWLGRIVRSLSAIQVVEKTAKIKR